MDQSQSLDQKKGEIHFRSFHPQYMEDFIPLAQRILSFRQDHFSHLAFDGFRLSSYLEIGAELCLNGFILENRFGCRGFAADISPESLGLAREYGQRLNMERIPFRVCCDAHNLPFVNGVFPFVFAWGTLHHFPDPVPVLREARRVLHPDGLFYFDEEPIRRRLGVPLFRTDVPPLLTRAQKLLLKIGLLPYIATLGGKREVASGVHEGTFGIGELRSDLSVFNQCELTFNPQLTGGIPSTGKAVRAFAEFLWGKADAPGVLTRWFGGAASGKCFKHERIMEPLEGFVLGREGDRHLLPESRMLVKKAPVHDRIGAVIRSSDADRLASSVGLVVDGIPVQELTCKVDGVNIIVTGSIPEPSRSRDVLSVEIGLEGAGEAGAIFEKVFLQAAGDRGVYFEDRTPAVPSEPADFVPEHYLGCPNCVVVRDGCVGDLCNRVCEQVCPEGAIAVDPSGRARIDRSKCTVCLQCLYACPFHQVDRQPLVRREWGWLCENCGREYALRNGVLRLFSEGDEKDLE